MKPYFMVETWRIYNEETDFMETEERFAFRNVKDAINKINSLLESESKEIESGFNAKIAITLERIDH